MPSAPSRVKVVGPLVPYVAGFRAELESQGYRRHPVGDQLRLMAHLSRWMEANQLSLSDLGPEHLEEFLVARRQAGYVLWLSKKALVPLVPYLTGLGAVNIPPVPGPEGPAGELMQRYRSYLAAERALSQSTIVSYLHVARLFLSTRPQVDGLGLAELKAADVISFVQSECRARSVGSAKYVVTGLRSLLRFCHLEALTPRPLAGAVPAVAAWKLAGLPRGLSQGQVAALLSSCDRRTAFGRRDFAVLIFLARLGLRAGEVAALALEDVNWRTGEVIVRGKGPKQARLPLPADVGEALVGWLRRGRPRCQAREVFTRVRAPHRRLTSAGVSNIVFSACLRAGVPPVRAHVLRHTAATQMLAAGAGLLEVGQVLRHSSVLTTSIYAKVDRARLAELAKPWPTTAAEEPAR